MQTLRLVSLFWCCCVRTTNKGGHFHPKEHELKMIPCALLLKNLHPFRNEGVLGTIAFLSPCSDLSLVRLVERGESLANSQEPELQVHYRYPLITVGTVRLDQSNNARKGIGR